MEAPSKNHSEIDRKEIRGVNLRTILLIVSITGSAVYTASRIENKIDAVIVKSDRDKQIIDLQIKELDTRLEEVKNEIIENRRRYKESH